MASNSSTITVSRHNAQWEWEGDKSIWQQYPINVQQSISQAFDAGKKEVDVDITDEISMTIKFIDMIQMNKKTKFMRRIRLCLEMKDVSGYSVYEWQNENKKWESYIAEVMIKIADAINNDQTTLSVTCQTRSYDIDLKKLTQTNTSTNVVRKIRCVRSMTRLPLNGPINVPSNKRSLENDDEPTESTTKKRAVSKSTQPEASSIRTVTTVAGQAPVDTACTTMLGKAHVYSENKDIFDCMLNQANVGNNNNKFYLIQLLEENNNKKYYVWLRWGRVGYTGQTSMETYGSDLNGAKRAFCSKFSDKTKNDFYHRDTFTKYPGKYDYVQLDYNPSTSKKSEEDEENKKKRTEALEELKSRPIPESKLDKRVQDLIELVCNVRAMEEALLEMKFDAKKNPLGKLSSAQIKAGYAALKEIETFIKAGNLGAPFVEANNTYYTRIPHEFGRHAPPLIRTTQQLKHEIELLEALDDIEVAFSALKTDTNTFLNPVDQQYEQLKCHLHPIEKTDDMYKLIDKYLQSTHAATHQQYKMQIEDIFTVEREGEKEAFNDVGNKMLLWHGSRLTNFAGIMTQGLRIAPPEAPVTGYMFGKGLYFADMSSKSANYCYTTPAKNTGLVLLSEVALGKWNELLHANSNANKLPAGLSSVKALGSVAPNPQNEIKLDGDITVPMGPGESAKANNSKGYTLNYNEYIVYDTKQVRLRYLIRLKFLYN
ncbi:unnamed protein product [Adineta ricciae]|uniref:Poly [ADP-ribose] polymerase n=1 Tax=Adineta ricciae TaxID=249248 RepID=A0A814EAV0_ADIRI|nr:unnamed protein product [Adineta ricciae]CAF1608533.1 unnamed protein product [Adineta ricciae]